MPNRQWFCWNLCLKYRCGCSQTSSQHVCDENRGVTCHSWTAVRVTDKTCDQHRDVGGLNGQDNAESVEQDEQEVLVQDVPASSGRRVVAEGGGSYEQRPRRRAEYS